MIPRDTQINRIRELTRARRHGDALRAVAALRIAAPADDESLYLLAVNQRCVNDIAGALATLEQLEQRQPGMARLFQERGYCYVGLRDARRAVHAFECAVNLNQTLLGSWSMLEFLYKMAGEAGKQASAAEQLAGLQRLPSDVVQARGLVSDGRPAIAASILRGYLSTHPEDGAAREDLVRLLLARQEFESAGEHLHALLELEPNNVEYRQMQATAAAGGGDHTAAVQAYQSLLESAPDAAHLQLLLGHSLKALGRRPEAIACYRAAIAARADFGDAYWSLANLKNYRFTDPELVAMQAAMAAHALTPADRLHLHFALGTALEQRDQYAASWMHYSSGNAIKRAESRYRPDYIEADTRRQIEYCTREFFAARAGVGAPDPDPIFIVGLPRSGSTLLEQILASHSLVEGTQELHHIPRLVEELAGYPAALVDFEPQQFRRLGERYLHATRPYRKLGSAFFVDKMPNNFRHIGLIHLMLPNAKIIDARREPMACCFSNYKQLFASGQEFSYDQEFMARCYRDYLELMRHWDQALPHRVLRVAHEDLVDDLQANVRRLLDFCGLEFEPACLDFHLTARSINTASSEQVRRPIEREGLLQWRNYLPWLEGLKSNLGDALIRYREI